MKKIYLLACIIWFNFASAQQFHKVWDVNEQTFVVSPDRFTDLGTNLFMFSGYSQIFGTAGTDSTTYLLNPGRIGHVAVTPWISPVEWERYNTTNGIVCFPSIDTLNEACLAVSDGTRQGTRNIAVTDASGFNAEVYYVSTCDDKFWFYVDATSTEYLWVSDGTPVGTHPTLALSYGVPDAFAPGCYNGKVAYSYNDDSNGPQAWLADSAGTSGTMISDIVPGVSDGIAPTTYFTFNGKLYFNGSEGPSFIYQSDGTVNAAVPLLSSTGGGIPSTGFEKQTFFYASGNKMYFLAGNQFGHTAIWVSDGTNAGTMPLLSDTNTDVYPLTGEVTTYPQGLFAPLGDKLIFGGNDGTHGYELWITDGTPAGTSLLKDINPNGDSYAQLFTAYNGKVYFMATDTTADYQLWATDGTSAGTEKITNTNATLSNPFALTQNMIAYNGSLYFNAHYDTSGDILYTFSTPPVTNSIESLTPQATFNIWPNPATDKVQIILNDFNSSPIEIYLFDITGKLAGKMENSAGQISTFDISHFADGVYFVRIAENNQLLPGVRKLVKD